ncbi:hypothetical protein RCCGEPOP_11119 [Rhizobium sp. Pop5]|nr:hypothetical protein RCCGEPOP_11119 [Rhizobium sp. Pop5]
MATVAGTETAIAAIAATVAGTAIAEGMGTAAATVVVAATEEEVAMEEEMAMAAAMGEGIPEIAPAGTPTAIRDPLPLRQARRKPLERERPKLPMARSTSVTRTVSLKPCEVVAIS